MTPKRSPTTRRAGSPGCSAARWRRRSAGSTWTYQGFQTTYTPDINNPATAITRNVDGTKIKGVEGQVTLNLNGFHGDAAFSVLDATYGHLNVVLPVGLYGNGLPAAPQLVDLNGRTIPFASKFSGAAGIAYDIPLGTGTITPSARVTRQSAQWVNFFQAAYNRIPARTLVSARLTYQAKHNWSVAAYANNLLDENYIATVDQSTNGTGSYVLGQPREYGVTMSYKF
jgi:iron complex outermembrane receptor protein